jgi:CBS domain-containing protein
MTIADIMSPKTHVTGADTTLAEAAAIMAENTIGFLPIAENDRLVGTLTDRDIVIAGLAKGREASARVAEVIKREVLYCRASDLPEDVAANMAQNAVRRLPVINDDKHLVGVVSLTDIADAADSDAAGETLRAIKAETERKAA